MAAGENNGAGEKWNCFLRIYIPAATHKWNGYIFKAKNIMNM